MRTLVVGDIHGGLKALQQVLQKVAPTKEDRFVFLGDYVDGWSEAAETVTFLLNFSETHDCIFLRGNHDYLMYRYLKHGDDNPMWLAHGGAASKVSYSTLSSEALKAHISFYENLINYHIDAKNRLYVHAGFTNLKGPEHEYFADLVFWDRTLWEMATALDPDISEEDIRYPQRLKLFAEIYIGHTPVSRMGATRPLHFANLWNIDTGAAFQGPLSIIDVATKEVWQSEPVYELYPLELGRN
jgi:serine/threonine protein phosphatase 1